MSSFIDDVSLNMYHNQKEETQCEICSALLSDADEHLSICNVCYGIIRPIMPSNHIRSRSAISLLHHAFETGMTKHKTTNSTP